ncbi:MAG: 8-oxo-dGTP diphosphatase [Gammaproteobacteria bacterium]|nr:8-oxo-dGTP diphosphatase [Gammaproteobacteria bacterium]MDE0226765.1 8-oxo-dGTP diphosphatase [Gammaproteobacteria bacterium]
MPRDPCIPRDWEPGERATLVYLLHGNSVLLIRKLRGHGAGKVNAPGGRVEAGESVEAAAIREVAEEVGVRVQALELRARLRYEDPAEGLAMEGFAFVSSEFQGTPTRTAEADPFWCRINEIPYGEMWENDRTWLPRVLRGERIRADFRYCRSRLVAHTVIPDTNISV